MSKIPEAGTVRVLAGIGITLVSLAGVVGLFLGGAWALSDKGSARTADVLFAAGSVVGALVLVFPFVLGLALVSYMERKAG